MPFTPVTEADLAPAGFQPVAEADLASDEPAAQPSTVEALGRGALQGASLGFSDEITGALESILTDKKYTQARDESRAANAAAQSAHPIAFGGAELASGLATPIPGLGALKAGGAVATHALRGAVAGGLAGLGGSNADLTKGGFGQAVNDTVESALLGGAIGAVGGKLGDMVGKAGAKSEDQAVKAIAGAESKTSKAAWQKTKRMVNNPETKSILHEDVQVETDGKAKSTSLEKVAGAEPERIQEVVDAQTQRINGELRPIYEKADAKNGGVKLSDYVKHLDEQIKATEALPPTEAKVYRGALSELRDNALEQWGQRNADLMQAMSSKEAREPNVERLILKQYDVKIPSNEVRGEATALQKIGFKTVDPLNPGLSTQVKRDMGNMVRDFVNQHVLQTLGGEDHEKLLGLNKRMNAWLGVGTVAAARAEKAQAGSMSLGGTGHGLLQHGSLTAGITGAMMGHPAALALPVAAKAIQYAPAAIRGTTRAVAKVDTRLKAVADAAQAGNPFAKQLVATLSQTPEGAARLAALQRTATAPATAQGGQ